MTVNSPDIKKKNPAFRFDFPPAESPLKKTAEKPLVLLVQHSQHKGWIFPKGIIKSMKRRKKYRHVITLKRNIEQNNDPVQTNSIG